MTRPAIVHHSGALDGKHPPNSLAAVEASLAHGAAWIEIDVAALASDDFVVVHDLDLGSRTTGSGLARDCTVADARMLRFQGGGEPVALLSDVVAAFAEAGGGCRLQLDLKDERPYPNDEPIQRLLRIVEPLGSRVLVSSVADWQLRSFRRLAPDLALGFDPLLYLAWWPPEWMNHDIPPFRNGAYGYLDDHPLAAERDLPPAEYLRRRCEMLLDTVPGIEILYVYHQLLLLSLDDGFNWAEACHARGISLDAWTMDLDREGMDAKVRRLADAGVDLFTTNTPREMASLLGR